MVRMDNHNGLSFTKPISSWNGLSFAEGPSLAEYRSKVLYKIACIDPFRVFYSPLEVTKKKIDVSSPYQPF